MRSLAAAAQFLTCLPLAGVQTSVGDRARAASWFGAVGLLLGLTLCGAEILLRPVFPLLPRLVVILVLNALFTGGLHLDGLADSFDSFGAGSDRAKALAIMRDSRIGTFGVLALLGVFALQFSFLAALPAAALSRALLLAPAWGRASLVVSAALSSSARPDGLGAAMIAGVRPVTVFWALVPAALATGFVGGRPGLASALAALLLAVLAARFWRARLGGQTGDTLGCLNQLAETATFGFFLVVR